MNERLSRRDVLKGGLGIAALAGIGKFAYSEALSTPESEIPPSLTYDTAIGMAKRFGDLYSAIPREDKLGIASTEDMTEWIREIVPFFEYEGITDTEQEIGETGGLVYPTPEIADYQDGLYHNHVLGLSEVFGEGITLNGRITNPKSSWYARTDSIATLIHELAHAQGIKFSNSNIDEESSAQLVTLEILAAMSNKGNRKTIPPLLDELSGMSLAAANYIALDENRESEFKKDRNAIFTDPLMQANFAKAERYWEEDPDHLKKILFSYNFVPINELIKGLNNQNRIDGVYMPSNWLANMINSPSYGYTAGYYAERVSIASPVATSTPFPSEPLKIDDLAYFFANAEELSEAVGGKVVYKNMDHAEEMCEGVSTKS